MGIRRLRWTCCHFSLHCGSDAGCSDRRVTVFRLEGQKGDGEPQLFFVSLSFIFKLQCRLPWPWVHLNLQNLTLSSINLYIRPSGTCIELFKQPLVRRIICREILPFFFFTCRVCTNLFFFFLFLDRLVTKIEALSFCCFFFFFV